MFEYGLWSHDDLDFVLTKIYRISEVMFNLETRIFKDRNTNLVTDGYLK